MVDCWFVALIVSLVVWGFLIGGLFIVFNSGGVIILLWVIERLVLVWLLW